jgi:hypothetical protein
MLSCHGGAETNFWHDFVCDDLEPMEFGYMMYYGSLIVLPMASCNPIANESPSHIWHQRQIGYMKL